MVTKKGYGQFCPVAQAAEVFAERWTPLVLRELMSGSHRFGELRKGVPLMSPSLLSLRLKELERAGVVERRPGAPGRSGANGAEYHLTLVGEQLRPVIELLGLWGHQWLRRGLTRDELDPALLMWDMRRCVDGTVLAERGRTVVRFDLTGAPAGKARWWLLFDDGEVDLCIKNPGHAVDLRVSSSVRALVEIWLGHVQLDDALRSQRLVLDGNREMRQSFTKWFTLSGFARAG